MKKLFIVFAMLFACALCASAQITEKGFKVTGSGAYYLNTATGDHVGQAEIGFGYQLGKYLYVGVQSGLWGPVESNKKNPIWDVPAFGNVQLSIPTNGKITPLVDILAGTTAKAFSKSNRYEGKALPKYTMFEIMPGLAYDLSKTVALKGNVGYLMMDPTTVTGHKQNNLLFKLSAVISL